MEKNQKILATENRISRIFKFSERKVRDYFKAARVAPGKYDLLDCIDIFVEASENKDESNELKRVDKELKEYKLGILKEEYHHRDNIALLVTDMLAKFKAKLVAIPSKGSRDLLNKADRRDVEKILKKLIDEALNELSSYDDLNMDDIDKSIEEDD